MIFGISNAEKRLSTKLSKKKLFLGRHKWVRRNVLEERRKSEETVTTFFELEFEKISDNTSVAKRSYSSSYVFSVIVFNFIVTF
ncbi:hypothetical protein L3Y34_005761 [Caenorhabditis briggsae]|uniref:Uncharacterized protein n=1 Tax=Caenorhabditis briggsae TaxID=6238 RepID=A0AAE9IKI0_CAEBR|nr:hypothetical protein L3Y34_005761 [Caenorhabditis briggsae]